MEFRFQAELHFLFGIKIEYLGFINYLNLNLNLL